MAKILLVEDDNNLREIYEARLQAEGYDIVSAKDGEEALVVAKKERPDLIVADVMMPRVSGFEMLDILRNTPELKDVHVIMLTALGQAEDKTRADSLGADRYLVKSQVTLEDIVKSAADVLAGVPANSPAVAAAAAGQAPPVPQMPVAAPPSAEPVAAAATTPAPTAPMPDATAVTNAPQMPAPPSVSIPVATPVPPVADVPQPQSAPPVAPAAQPAAAPVVPEPSTTDSQLVTDAVNNLVAGSPQDTTAPAPQPAPAPPQPIAPQITPVSPAPAPSPVVPQPQPPLTMQPVLTPPVLEPTPVVAAPPAPSPIPAPAGTSETTLTTTPATSRKAITPLPAGSSPAQADLSELVAKEGHDMDDTSGVQSFNNPAHMPGNVITPGGPAPATAMPPMQNPTDPNSISL